MKKKWEKSEFSKTIVLYCLRVMTITLVWSMILSTAAVVLDRTYDVSDVLVFAGGFYGGELILLAFKRIFAKERDADDQSDTDP